MKDWKVRQQVYHQLHADIDLGDSLEDYQIVEEHNKEKMAQRAVDYINVQTKELYYPAKSYIVAITYAYLISHHFDDDFIQCLDDQDLLFGNDPYFIPYSQDKETYDNIIKDLPENFFLNPEKYCENFNRTCEYFHKEFLLHEETSIYAPA